MNCVDQVFLVVRSPHNRYPCIELSLDHVSNVLWPMQNEQKLLMCLSLQTHFSSIVQIVMFSTSLGLGSHMRVLLNGYDELRSIDMQQTALSVRNKFVLEDIVRTFASRQVQIQIGKEFKKQTVRAGMIVGEVIVLHVVYSGLIPTTPEGPLTLPGVTNENRGQSKS